MQDHRIYYFGIASEFCRQRAHHHREVPRSRWDDVRARCRLRTNFLCLHIDRFLSELDCDFDVVLLGNSRLGYVARALRNRARCMVTYHANVEADYIRHKYALPVFSWIDGALFRLRERQCADLTDRSLFLQSGTVTVVQRTSSDLRLNPHLHVLALNGVFVEQPDDSPPRFVQLPNLASIDVAELLATIRTQVLRLLARRSR